MAVSVSDSHQWLLKLESDVLWGIGIYIVQKISSTNYLLITKQEMITSQWRNCPLTEWSRLILNVWDLLINYTSWCDALKWSETRSVVSNSLRPHGLYGPWNSPGQNAGVSSLSLLQGIFPTQELNWGLLHCRWILYQLSYQGSPNVQEWGLNEIMDAKPTEAHGDLSRNVSTYHNCSLHMVSYDCKWFHLRTSKIV